MQLQQSAQPVGPVVHPITIETKHIYKHIKTKFYIWPTDGYEVGVQGQAYWLWVEDLLISLVLHNPDDVDSTNYFGARRAAANGGPRSPPPPVSASAAST
ncbi:unnamed protein product [Lepidochelys olivacea]